MLFRGDGGVRLFWLSEKGEFIKISEAFIRGELGFHTVTGRNQDLRRRSGSEREGDGTWRIGLVVPCWSYLYHFPSFIEFLSKL